MSRKSKFLAPDAPLLHADHKRPVSRRDFIAQGFMTGAGVAMSTGLMGLLGSSNAQAALSQDLDGLLASCNINVNGAGKIPFICFDLGGGANIAGSNVLVGGRGGQDDFLSTAGYSKLGLPGDMVPAIANPNNPNGSDFIDRQLGLAFHSDSAILRGILASTQASTRPNVNGCVLPARSENDTGNNPHNPMYGINRYGADGSLLTLIGSQATTSGARSMAPAYMIDNSKRPTKVSRPSDVTGLVDVGDLTSLLSQADAVAVMETIQRISKRKLDVSHTKVTRDAVIKELLNCNYIKSASLADRFGNPSSLDPAQDANIVGNSGIFSNTEFNSDGEFRKTASIMKLVLNGYAGAGTITMGGFDYHTGERATGELRDLRAGRCIGACLEYAARLNKPVMIYIYSDGAVSSNGAIDESMNGRGKGQWTSDNSSAAASFFLVYNPGSQPVLIGASDSDKAVHQQLGYMRAEGSVETSSSVAANNVITLSEAIILNYMALHGQQNQFAAMFPSSVIKSTSLIDKMTAFEPIVNGNI